MTNEMLKKLENDGRFDDRDKEAIAKCLDTDAAWDADACATVCKLADMMEEYANAGEDSFEGDTFEDVVFAALEKLGYEYGWWE